MTMFIAGDVSPRQLESLKRVASKCKIGNTLVDSPELVFNIELAP
jgi:uncharacterized OsmC-like protein